MPEIVSERSASSGLLNVWPVSDSHLSPSSPPSTFQFSEWVGYAKTPELLMYMCPFGDGIWETRWTS